MSRKESEAEEISCVKRIEGWNSDTKEMNRLLSRLDREETARQSSSGMPSLVVHGYTDRQSACGGEGGSEATFVRERE